MPNRLANETSSYLLQHKNNPVDWYPWGEEALQKAKRENKPIFLSIGYSACHWCHVMEHESFENEAIAATINKNFVPIKVDREERPDLDHIYMNAVQMLTGRGGWPMSVFLTPDLKPFYGGTYWPPKASRGMPGFDQILAGVSQAWEQRREKALAGADQITEEINNLSRSDEDSEAIPLSLTLVDNGARQLERTFDSTYGGFGGAPKFPQAMMAELLLRHYQRTGQESSLTMVRTTLDRMAGGGVYDHLGGGFARYSVDVRWLVPHFEKMLYDNSLLTGVFLDAHLVTGDDNYSRVVRESLDYILRDMTDPAGVFYSTEDADSEGEEGKFYVWSLAEVTKLLGEEKAATFGRVYDVTAAGNFEGHNILHLPKTIAQCAAMLDRNEAELRTELAESRATLFEARTHRVRPGLDDKVLVSWNGLMIDSMARAGAALEEPRYTDAAAVAARFVLAEMRREDGRLLHTWRNGKAKLDAYLDGYVCLANGLVSLYEATFDEQWIEAAVALMDTVLEKFADPDSGGFFFTTSDHEALITRTKEVTDASTPSGNGMAAVVLLRLGALLGRGDYFDAAEGTLQSAASMLQRAPQATGQLLIALERHLGQSRELVLVYEQKDQELAAVLRDLRGRFLPNCVIAARALADNNKSMHSKLLAKFLEPAFAGKQTIDGQPTLYVCEKFACQQPVAGVKAIRGKLDELAG